MGRVSGLVWGVSGMGCGLGLSGGGRSWLCHSGTSEGQGASPIDDCGVVRFWPCLFLP